VGGFGNDHMVHPLKAVLADDDGSGILRLAPQPMLYSLAATEALLDWSDACIGMLFRLQWTLGFSTFTVILKLFKSFEANGRLQLVTSTLACAAEDLFHFGVVSSGVMVGFALTAHAFFGADMPEFSTVLRSLNTQFECMQGDFGWYSDFAASDKMLSSGMPRYVVTMWFYSFIVFMVLVILNMLLAIVMDHYMSLLVESRQDPANSPTLWTQIHRQYLRWRDQKDFIPNFMILS